MAWNQPCIDATQRDMFISPRLNATLSPFAEQGEAPHPHQEAIDALLAYQQQEPVGAPHGARAALANVLLRAMDRSQPAELDLVNINAEAFNALPEAVGPALMGKVTHLRVPAGLDSIPTWVMRLVPSSGYLDAPDFRGDRRAFGAQFAQRFGDFPSQNYALPASITPPSWRDRLQVLRADLLAHPHMLNIKGPERLAQAVLNRDLEAVKIMLDAGIGDPMDLVKALPKALLKDDLGLQNIQRALVTEATQRAKMLEAIHTGNQPALQSLLDARGELGALMLSHGLLQTRQGPQTLLSCVLGGESHVQIAAPQLNVLNYLIDRGADVNVYRVDSNTSEGMSAMEMGCQHVQTEVREALVLRSQQAVQPQVFSRAIGFYRNACITPLRGPNRNSVQSEGDFVNKVMQKCTTQANDKQSMLRFLFLLDELPGKDPSKNSGLNQQILHCNQRIIDTAMQSFTVNGDRHRAAADFAQAVEMLQRRPEEARTRWIAELLAKFMKASVAQDQGFLADVLRTLVAHGYAAAFNDAMDTYPALKARANDLKAELLDLVVQHHHARSVELLQTLLKRTPLSMEQMFEPVGDHWQPALLHAAQHIDPDVMVQLLGKPPKALPSFATDLAQHLQTCIDHSVGRNFQSREAVEYASAASAGEELTQRMAPFLPTNNATGKVNTQGLRAALHLGAPLNPDTLFDWADFSGTLPGCEALVPLLHDTYVFMHSTGKLAEWEQKVAPALLDLFVPLPSSARQWPERDFRKRQMANVLKKVQAEVHVLARQKSHRNGTEEAVNKAQAFFKSTRDTLLRSATIHASPQMSAALLMCTEMAASLEQMSLEDRLKQRSQVWTVLGLEQDSPQRSSIEYYATDLADMLTALAPLPQTKAPAKNLTEPNRPDTQDVRTPIHTVADAPAPNTTPQTAFQPVTDRAPNWVMAANDDAGWTTVETRPQDGTPRGVRPADKARLTLQIDSNIWTKEYLRHTRSGRDGLPRYNQGNPSIFESERLSLEFLQAAMDQGQMTTQTHTDGSTRLLFEHFDTASVGHIWNATTKSYEPSNRVRVVVAQRGRMAQLISAYPIR